MDNLFLLVLGAAYRDVSTLEKSDRALPSWLVHFSVRTLHFNKKFKEKLVARTFHMFSIRWDKV